MPSINSKQVSNYVYPRQPTTHIELRYARMEKYLYSRIPIPSCTYVMFETSVYTVT